MEIVKTQGSLIARNDVKRVEVAEGVMEMRLWKTPAPTELLQKRLYTNRSQDKLNADV